MSSGSSGPRNNLPFFCKAYHGGPTCLQPKSPTTRCFALKYQLIQSPDPVPSARLCLSMGLVSVPGDSLLFGKPSSHANSRTMDHQRRSGQHTGSFRSDLVARSALFQRTLSSCCPQLRKISLLSALFRSLCGVASLALATPCHTPSISPRADKKLLPSVLPKIIFSLCAALNAASPLFSSSTTYT